MDKHTNEKTIFGFWVYLMTDLIMFATLFATFAVLRNNTFGGPSGRELFSLPFALIETLILLTSSFTVGLTTLAANENKKSKTVFWLTITFLLGVSFLAMEINEFRHLFAEGASFQTSAFLSSFFTLVGTHGVHIASGLLWIIIMLQQILSRGLEEVNLRKLNLLGLFWHFLDIVWIFIFTIVYLMGKI